jgi:hypothetical protein
MTKYKASLRLQVGMQCNPFRCNLEPCEIQLELAEDNQSVNFSRPINKALNEAIASILEDFSPATRNWNSAEFIAMANGNYLIASRVFIGGEKQR